MVTNDRTRPNEEEGFQTSGVTPAKRNWVNAYVSVQKNLVSCFSCLCLLFRLLLLCILLFNEFRLSFKLKCALASTSSLACESLSINIIADVITVPVFRVKSACVDGFAP